MTTKWNLIRETLFLCLFVLSTVNGKPPNIIFIVADDLGWNDVSWNNEKVQTPVLQGLAANGVILNQSYVLPVCSPSRAAMMTGYYPYRIGRQESVLKPWLPTGVDVTKPFLSNKLKELGYVTHAIGKWHLGFCNEKYTPLRRGFDTFFGSYIGAVDYYTYERAFFGVRGFDLRVNDTVARSRAGKYSTVAFGEEAVKIIRSHDGAKPLFIYLPFQAVHGPLKAPREYIRKYRTVKNVRRRKYLGMVSAMDEAIGNITAALRERGMMEDTTIIFTSDNRGQNKLGGNNWPLRGNKGSLWEGGTRVPTFVHGYGVFHRGTSINQMVHAVDWFPTILALAGSSSEEEDIDGVNQWFAITLGIPSQRNEIVYNIKNSVAAIRMKNYKLIIGNPGPHSMWYSPNIRRYRTSRERFRVLLYDLEKDPQERNNIAPRHGEMVSALVQRLHTLRMTRGVPPDLPPLDPAGAPPNWGGTFSPGWC